MLARTKLVRLAGSQPFVVLSPFHTSAILHAKEKAPAAKGAPKGGGSKKKDVSGPSAADIELRKQGGIPALAITKTGEWSTPWHVFPDEDYPDWLWTLTKPEPNLDELRKMITESDNVAGLPNALMLRYIRLSNRARIKEKNIKSASK